MMMMPGIWTVVPYELERKMVYLVLRSKHRFPESTTRFLRICLQPVASCMWIDEALLLVQDYKLALMPTSSAIIEKLDFILPPTSSST